MSVPSLPTSAHPSLPPSPHPPPLLLISPSPPSLSPHTHTRTTPSNPHTNTIKTDTHTHTLATHSATHNTQCSTHTWNTPHTPSSLPLPLPYPTLHLHHHHHPIRNTTTPPSPPSPLTPLPSTSSPLHPPLPPFHPPSPLPTDTNRATDDQLHVLVVDVGKLFDTVDFSILDCALGRLSLLKWFRRVHFSFHAQVRARVKLAASP